MEVAGDLTGLQRAFGAGLWYGLARAFWGPCWPDLGPCWGFAYGLESWRAVRGLAMPIFTACIHSNVRRYSTKGML